MLQLIYEGKSVFPWLPTGFGKEVCTTSRSFNMDYKLGRVGTSKDQCCDSSLPLFREYSAIASKAAEYRTAFSRLSTLLAHLICGEGLTSTERSNNRLPESTSPASNIP